MGLAQMFTPRETHSENRSEEYTSYYQKRLGDAGKSPEIKMNLHRFMILYGKDPRQ